ncbi:MAG: PrsW family intramembrane metalloprotease [Chloroflexi bacterium]|nr:PrsW family intramembrane metalloprotease [Chloroflexota bacterium]
MIPTVVLLGSFLVPATAVVWYFDHYHSDVVTPALAVRGFILGGVLGVLAASVLEAWLLSSGVLIFVGVGLIEEFAKGIGLFFVARHLRRYTVRDGIVLGAAVGFGFAALESSGYALNALIVPQGSGVVLSLGNLVTTEVLRGILAPVGHGLWTAILGGAMFGAARKVGHLRVNGAVFWTYLLVSLLHAIWDSMQMIAILFATLFLATQGQILDPWTGRVVPPPAAEAFSYLGFYFGGLIILSLVGIGILAHSWRSAGARLPAEIGTTTASNAGDVPTIAPHDLPS